MTDKRLYRWLTHEEKEALTQQAKQEVLAAGKEEYNWRYTKLGKSVQKQSLVCILCGKRLSDHAFARTKHGGVHVKEGRAYSYAPNGYTTEFFVRPDALLTDEERERKADQNARKALLNEVVKKAWDSVPESGFNRYAEMRMIEALIDDPSVSLEKITGKIRLYRMRKQESATENQARRRARDKALEAVGSSWDEWYVLNHGEEEYRKQCAQSGREPKQF